jgi:hypothetical protein
MAEQSDRTERASGAGGRAPGAEGWRARAEQAHRAWFQIRRGR